MIMCCLSMREDSVGIGTISLAYKLDVAGSASFD